MSDSSFPSSSSISFIGKAVDSSLVAAAAAESEPPSSVDDSPLGFQSLRMVVPLMVLTTLVFRVLRKRANNASSLNLSAGC